MQFHVQKQTFSVPLASCNDFDSWFHLATSNYVQRRTLQMLWCVFQLLHWIWHLPLKLFHILHELSRNDILFPWTQIMSYHNHSHRPLWESNFMMIYLFFVVAYPWNNNYFPEVLRTFPRTSDLFFAKCHRVVYLRVNSYIFCLKQWPLCYLSSPCVRVYSNICLTLTLWNIMHTCIDNTSRLLKVLTG